MTKQQEKYKIK